MPTKGRASTCRRDGVEEEYLALAVPAAVTAVWLEELTATHVSKLSTEGNWWSVYFLSQHADYRHVALVLASEPQGKLWERCAYLETMLRYVHDARGRGLASAEQIDDARRIVLKESEKLRRRARSERSRSRIAEIGRSASLM